MTEQNDNERIPSITMGIAVYPMITTNFVTDLNGNNEVVKEIQAMFSEIMDATVDKIFAAIAMYCMMQGIDFNKMPTGEVVNHVRYMVNNSPDNSNVKGIYNPETGEHNLDPDFLKHTASGRRTDS